MLIRVIQAGSKVQEYHFTRGPIHIGRHELCHIRLSGGMVSRQHAMIYFTIEGEPVLQDLNSANGTILNGKACQEQPLHNGDTIQIGQYRLEIDRSDESSKEEDLIPEDTTFENERVIQVITRDHTIQEAPEIILPIKRIADFSRASRSLCKETNQHDFLQMFVMILLQQFRASRIWCSIRADVNGRSADATGVTHAGQKVAFEDIELKQELKQAMDTGQFLLVPSTSDNARVKVPCSAMIAPLLEWRTCMGVVYIDRNADWCPFTLNDLDYLMLLTIQAGALLSSFSNQPAS